MKLQNLKIIRLVTTIRITKIYRQKSIRLYFFSIMRRSSLTRNLLRSKNHTPHATIATATSIKKIQPQKPSAPITTLKTNPDEKRASDISKPSTIQTPQLVPLRVQSNDPI